MTEQSISRLAPAFRVYVAPARAYPQIWRLVAGLTLTIVVYTGILSLLVALLWVLAPAELLPVWFNRISGGTTPLGMLLLLLTFGGLVVGTAVAARVFHYRSLASLLGPRRLVVGDFLTMAGVVFATNILALILLVPGYEPVPNLTPNAWLLLLPIAVAGVLLQTGAEEILFRGYLQQQLAARFRSPLIWLVLPAVAFGLLHHNGGAAGPNTALVVVTTLFFGLIAGDLTARSGALGAAWGFHFANNVLALLVIATQGALPGLALFVTPFTARDPQAIPPILAVDLLTMLVAWLVARRILRGRMKERRR